MATLQAIDFLEMYTQKQVFHEPTQRTAGRSPRSLIFSSRKEGKHIVTVEAEKDLMSVITITSITYYPKLMTKPRIPLQKEGSWSRLTRAPRRPWDTLHGYPHDQEDRSSAFQSRDEHTEIRGNPPVPLPPLFITRFV